MTRSLNSQCDFENGFFTCDLPEDTILMILKVKTQTGNHTLVDDMEKQTENFWPWKKQVKDGKQVLQKLLGVLTSRENDNSVTSDSGPCPSLTEHEYKPGFFDELDCLSSNKENMPPIELVTPPSLRNLSLEEETYEPEHKATLREANVARNLETLPWSSSLHPRKMSTLEDLEPDRDNNMVDVTDFLKDPLMRNCLLDLYKLTWLKDIAPHLKNSPIHVQMNSAAAVAPAKPHRNEIQGILPDKRKVPHRWPACLSHPG